MSFVYLSIFKLTSVGIFARIKNTVSLRLYFFSLLTDSGILNDYHYENKCIMWALYVILIHRINNYLTFWLSETKNTIKELSIGPIRPICKNIDLSKLKGFVNTLMNNTKYK